VNITADLIFWARARAHGFKKRKVKKTDSVMPKDNGAISTEEISHIPF